MSDGAQMPCHCNLLLYAMKNKTNQLIKEDCTSSGICLYAWALKFIENIHPINDFANLYLHLHLTHRRKLPRGGYKKGILS